VSSYLANFGLEHLFMEQHRDQDREKGALESDDPQQAGNNSMHGQLGHRDQDPRTKKFDTDFPEPGENPEHSGEPQADEKTDDRVA
jgi:hypothetical protein